MPCVAVHAIWTTYMTWPPGDPRGHWSALLDVYGHLIERGHRLNLPDPVTADFARANAKEPERILTDDDRLIVAEAIEDVLHQLKPHVEIFAAAIEPTHVHLLLGPSTHAIGQLIGRLKGRSSAEVIARGSERGRSRTWTTGYWKVFIDEPAAIPVVKGYIEAHNTRRGLAAAPFGWIRDVG